MFQRALQGNENALGLEHSSTLDSVNCIGNLYMEQGKLVEAEEAYQRALQGYEKTLGLEHTSTLCVVKNIGLLYRNQNKLAEAERMYMRALEGYEKILDLDHTPARSVIFRLGRTYYYCCDILRRKRLPKSTEADEFESKIRSLARLCEKFGVIAPYLFGFLGRVLIWDGQDDNAVIALEQQIDPSYGGTICDGCGKSLSLKSKLFVCKVCLDIDLCIECHENYKIEGKFVKTFSENCQAHGFIAVPRENWAKLDHGIKGLSLKL